MARRRSRLPALALLALLAPAVAGAATDKLSFTEQCPILLKQAADFARECREKARSIAYAYCPHPFFGFCGTKAYKNSYVYFRAVDTGSHFGLGCRMGDDRREVYVSIYYALKSSDFAIANTAPLEGANGTVKDPDANDYIKFEDVRDLATDSVAPVPIPDRPKNCEPSQQSDGWARVLQDGSMVDVPPVTRAPDGTLVIKSCFSRDPDSCRSGHYESVFRGDDRRIIHGDMFTFVTDQGDLLIKKDYLRTNCPHDPKLEHSNLCELLTRREQAATGNHTKP